jgi:integrase
MGCSRAAAFARAVELSGAALAELRARESLDDRWAHALRELAEDLAALTAQARAAGLDGPLVAEADRAAAEEVGAAEVQRLRAHQRRHTAAMALAQRLRAAGRVSEEVAEWAPEEDMQDE